MSAGVFKEKLILDTTSLSDSDNIGAYLRDSAGNLITSQVNGSQQALDVGINVAGVQIDPRQIRALTSSDVVTADQGGTWNITNITGTISLPTGAATSANQSTIITDLGTINTTLGSPMQNSGGSVTANQGGTWTVQPGNTANTVPWLVTDQANGSATGGTAATVSELSGGIYNSTSPTLTNGQQASLQLDSKGNLMVDLAYPLTVSTTVASPDIAVNNQNVTVTTTAAKLLSSELAVRKNMLVQNLGNKAIYLGSSASVTSSNGFSVAAGSTFAVDLGPDVSLYAVASSGSMDVRVLQFS